jgi:hypothetical protein
MSVCGRHAPTFFLPERDPVPIAQEAGPDWYGNAGHPIPGPSSPQRVATPARESAEESVAIRDLSIASVPKQDDVPESEFVSVIRWKYREALTGLVQQKELLLQDGRYQSAASIYAPIIRFCPRETKKNAVHLQLHTCKYRWRLTGSRKEKYASCGSGATARNGPAVLPPTKNDLRVSQTDIFVAESSVRTAYVRIYVTHHIYHPVSPHTVAVAKCVMLTQTVHCSYSEWRHSQGSVSWRARSYERKWITHFTDIWNTAVRQEYC